MTRDEAKNVRLRCPDDKARWLIFVDGIYDNFENKSCKGCISFENGICTDHKGHYCIRGNSMEDRYVEEIKC